MEMKMKIASIIIIGISILCQQNNCDEISISTTLSSSSSTPLPLSSLASSTGKSKSEDDGDLTTTSTIQSTKSSNKTNGIETKTSITSTTVTHSLRIVEAASSASAANDESLIDVTTSADSICLPKNEGDQSYIVDSIDGDIMVTTIISHHSTNNATEIIRFIVKRINEIDLLVNGVTIGVRVVQIVNIEKLLQILENESEYLEHCVDNPFGIFLSSELWKSDLLKEKNFEFKVWPLPSSDDIRVRKIAQLLNEFPILQSQANVSVEIRTDSLNRNRELKMILKSEKLCFDTAKLSTNNSEKFIIYYGDANFFSTIKNDDNETLFILPLINDVTNVSMTNLPNGSFISLEHDIFIQNLTTTPSELIVVSATFLEICKSINNAIWKNCKDSKVSTIKINLATCDILDDLQVPENISTSDVRQMLKLFKLDTNTLESQLTFDIYKKLMSKTNETTLTKIAAANFVANVTTFYIPDQYKFFSLGSISSCDLIQTNNDIVKTNSSQNISQIDNEAKHPAHVDAKFEMNDKFPPQLNTFDLRNDNGDDIEAYNWQIRSELWVAIGLTISTLGILLCIAILTFILARICMEDVLEGNPIGSILLLLALIAQFASFFPFTIEYRGYKTDHFNTSTAIEIFNSMCTIRIFVVSVCYCLTFSLLLSRAIMLASIGSEGGFLSHVNGYIQSVICIFSFLVQLGLSTQLLIMMHANQKHVTCEHVFYGNWFWAILGYDMMLLIMLVGLSPFIFRSQRNYQEGILIVITAVLCLICWMIWIPLSTISNNFREIAVPLGVQATGWIVLASLMVPRCFLIVRSIARSDFTQALPSLTSLAFAQANQFNSEPSLYECVNPAMRHQQSTDDSLSQTQAVSSVEEYLSPSEVPTLPLRGSLHRNFIEHYQNNINFNEIINPSPNKMTRF